MNLQTDKDSVALRGRIYSPPTADNHNSANNAAANFSSVMADLRWLEKIVEKRINEHAGKPIYAITDDDLQRPDISANTDAYATLIRKHDLAAADRVLLAVAISHHVAPDVFNLRLINPERNYQNLYPVFGGYVDKVFQKFVPTFSTVIYLLSGSNREEGLDWQLKLRSKSPLIKTQMVQFRAPTAAPQSTNLMDFEVQIESEYVRYILTGEPPQPDFGSDFPATMIRTEQTWQDLVLADAVVKKIQRLVRWMKHGPDLLENNRHKINPSFPCLFYGPPGTGKTLTAKLIGKKFNQPVFRISLPAVVSKYVGETEKNLARLFDRAEGKDWILFFDEADAIFGKRTEIRDSNDKWANLEVAYLLQRIEEYEGLIILSSNLKENMDKALTRRFQAVIEFPRPGKDEQLKLWETLIPNGFSYREDVKLDQFFGLQLTGANIANILKLACLDALAARRKTLSQSNLKSAMQEELAKENRTL